MRIDRPTALIAAALLTALPATLTATAAGASPPSANPTPVTAPTNAAAGASPSPSETASTPDHTPGAATTPSRSAASATPSASAPDDVPDGARLAVSPRSVPRLSNVMVEGSCTQLAPIEKDENGDEWGEQWAVDVTLSVDGEQINDPVLFASDYDGTFAYPVQIAGRDADAVPAPGDTVVVDAWCHEEDPEDGTANGKSFHLSDSVMVTDAPTCPAALPESTGELDADVAAHMSNDEIRERPGSYSGDGWEPGSDVLACYYTNPDYVDRPTPAQRFGGDVADADGAVSMCTIGPAVDPDDPTADDEDSASIEPGPSGGAGDPDDEDLARTAVAPAAADEGEGDEGEGDDGPREAIYTMAVIGTGADGSARVLTADVTPVGDAASGVLSAPLPNNAPTLPATGSDTLALARGGAALVVVGAGLFLLARRRRTEG